MYFVDVVNRGPTPLMEKMLAFTQARHQVLTENIANVDTPNYQAKHLDPKAFQDSLRSALAERERTRSLGLNVPSSRQARTDTDGRMVFKPTVEPAENILFHDKTNVRIEKQMAMLAENAMMHEFVANRLKARFDLLLTSIRGRMQ